MSSPAGRQNGAATVDDRQEVPQKVKCRIIIGAGHSTLGLCPELKTGEDRCSREVDVHSIAVPRSQKEERTQMSTRG